jgi:hypothetical protein
MRTVPMSPGYDVLNVSGALAALLKLERETLRHLGMSRGDGRCACGRTLCLRSSGRFTKKGIREEPKRT